jgi:hypothetical protein
MKVGKRALLGAAAIACGSVACNALIGWQSNYVESDGGVVDGQTPFDGPSPEGAPPIDGGTDAPLVDAPTADGPVVDAPTSDSPTCTPACTTGATQCASAVTVQSCSGTCPSWGAATTCPADAGITPYVCEPYSSSCADPTWAEWPMPNSHLESPPAPNLMSFTDNGDGTVTDNVTKLMWPKQYANGDDTWTNASTQCGTFSLAGHKDWRLPTVIELVSIVDYSLGPGDVFNAVFTNVPNTTTYWTSTLVQATSTPQAYFVSINNGATYYAATSTSYPFICVR